MRSRNWRGTAGFGVDPALPVRGPAQNREGDRGCASCICRDTPRRGLRRRTNPLPGAASPAPVAGPRAGGTHALGAAPSSSCGRRKRQRAHQMAFVLDRQFEHLLRRAGFGARPDELGLYRVLSIGERSTPLWTTSRSRTTSIRRSGSPNTPSWRAPAAAVLAAHEHSRRPAAVALPNAPQQPAAPGEDDPLLAQPLRNRVHEDSRRAWPGRGHPVHGRQTVRGSRRRARSDRDASRQRARQLPRHPDCHRAGSSDARVARRPDEHEGQAAGELRTRGHGTVHDGRRPLHRSRRVRGGSRVHRLEPAAVGRPGRRHAGFPVRLQRRPARHQREDVQLSHLPGRQQDDSRPPGSRRHARRHGSGDGARRRVPIRHGTLPPSCTASSSRSLEA